MDVSVQEADSPIYGLSLPQPYPFGLPEELPRSASTSALVASYVAMEGQGRLLGFTVTNTKAASQFVQIFDLAALPADGVVPILAKALPASDAVGFDWGTNGRWFTRGIVLCNSSTQGTKTLGSADCLFDVQFIPQVI